MKMVGNTDIRIVDAAAAVRGLHRILLPVSAFLEINKYDKYYVFSPSTR